MTNIPEQVYTKIMHFEGFRSQPYVCPAGYYTIGFGHRCSKNHKPISRQTAYELLKSDFAVHFVNARLHFPNLSVSQLCAVADLFYNVGYSKAKTFKSTWLSLCQLNSISRDSDLYSSFLSKVTNCFSHIVYYHNSVGKKIKSPNLVERADFRIKLMLDESLY